LFLLPYLELLIKPFPPVRPSVWTLEEGTPFLDKALIAISPTPFNNPPQASPCAAAASCSAAATSASICYCFS